MLYAPTHPLPNHLVHLILGSLKVHILLYITDITTPVLKYCRPFLTFWVRSVLFPISMNVDRSSQTLGDGSMLLGAIVDRYHVRYN